VREREREIIIVQTFDPVQVCRKQKTSTVRTVPTFKPCFFSPDKS